MPAPAGYRCSTCGSWHDELPFAYHAPAPAYWAPEMERDERSELGEEQCVIGEEHFFVRGLVRLPVLDAEADFEWGVWVSLSRGDFLRMSDLWQAPGREAEPAYSGSLATALPTYSPSTLDLRTLVHTQPVGLRPVVELEPADHPLAREQREGITVARVQRLAELLLHPAG